MRKQVALKLLVAVITIALILFFQDGLIFLFTSLMGIFVLGLIRYNRSLATRITKWAKAKPKLAQWLIAILLNCLLALGIVNGKNLSELGVEISGFAPILFCAIMAVGFLSVPFFHKPGEIIIPKEVNRRRTGYLMIALSAFVLMICFGNRIERYYPNSPVTQIIESVDNWIFPDEIPAESMVDVPVPMLIALKGVDKESFDRMVNPDNGDHKTYKNGLRKGKKNWKKNKRKSHRKQRIDKKRKAFAAASGGGAGGLIFILVLSTCASICLMVFGIIGLTGGYTGGGVLLFLAGLVMMVGNIFGYKKASEIIQGNAKKENPD